MAYYRYLDKIEPFLSSVQEKEHQLIITLGDSNTCNTHFSQGAKQWPELLHSKIKQQYDCQRLLLVNAGVSGDTAHDGLLRLETDVLPFAPGLVIVCFGTNDANKCTPGDFESAMHQIIDTLLSINATILIRTPNPIMERQSAPSHIWRKHATFETLISLTGKIAEKYQLPFVDIYSYWIELEQSGVLQIEPLMYDEVHTNGAGHRKVFEALCPAFSLQPSSRRRG